MSSLPNLVRKLGQNHLVNVSAQERPYIDLHNQFHSHKSTNMMSLNKVNLLYFDKLFVAKNNTSLSAPSKGKVLLVDQHTMPIVAMSYTQSQLLQHDVILVEMLGKSERLSDMKLLNCVIYIKPCRESIAFVCEELKSPHYGHYQLFFSNTVAKNDLEKIAGADEYEVINQVMEIFQEYSVVNDNLFCIANPINPGTIIQKSAVQELAHLMSLLLSLKKCPVIKYDPSSLELKRLASEVLYGINSNSNNNLFDDLNKDVRSAPILLIVDRKFDPVTPLITPWTYQSMIHELIGIERNIVKLPENNEQLTLSETQDTFYHESMYLNYGDLTEKFQKHVDDYKKQTKQSSIQNLKTQDLTELKRILTRFPEFKKLSNNILKHLNIISEIDKQISRENLWAVGELQQTIACNLENHQQVRAKVMDLVADSTLSCDSKVKLLLLYASKFPQNTADLIAFVNKLKDPMTTNPPPTEQQLNLLKHFSRLFKGSFSTDSDADGHNDANDTNIGKLFSQNRIKIQQLFNSNVNSRNGPKNDNIYMQYIPKLESLLESLTSPPDSQYRTATSGHKLATMIPEVLGGSAAGDVTNVQDIIVYFKGGITYEEARLAHEFSHVNPLVNIVAGGDCILNSSQWLDRMCELASSSGESSSAATQPDRRSQLRDIL